MSRVRVGKALAVRGTLAATLVVLAMFGGGLGSAFADGASRSFPGCPMLREGDTGPCVAKLQEHLNGVLDYGLEENSRFDPPTRIAVLDFQGRHHLGADARVGAATADLLTTEYKSLHPEAPPVDSPRPQPMSPSSSGCDIDHGYVSGGNGTCVPDGGTLGGKPILDCAGAVFGLTKSGLDIYKIIDDSRALGLTWEEGIAPKLRKVAPWLTAAYAFKCGWWDTPD